EQALRPRPRGRRRHRRGLARRARLRRLTAPTTSAGPARPRTTDRRRRPCPSSPSAGRAAPRTAGIVLTEPAEPREEYTHAGLDEADLAPDPVEQFRRWFTEWRPVAVGDPNAMVVATATPDGRPSVRTVLLRALDHRGFVFFSNHESRKG